MSALVGCSRESPTRRMTRIWLLPLVEHPCRIRQPLVWQAVTVLDVAPQERRTVLRIVKGWLFVHVPLTYALMVFVAAHVLLVLGFNGRIG